MKQFAEEKEEIKKKLGGFFQHGKDLSQIHFLRNPAEDAFAKEAKKKGWLLLRRGWPDFFMLQGDKLILVEVKPSRIHKLKPQQALVMTELAKRGIECWKWNPETGFERVEGDKSWDHYTAKNSEKD